MFKFVLCSYEFRHVNSMFLCVFFSGKMSYCLGVGNCMLRYRVATVFYVVTAVVLMIMLVYFASFPLFFGHYLVLYSIRVFCNE